MKKLASVIISLMLIFCVFTLSACGPNQQDNNNNNNNNSEPPPNIEDNTTPKRLEELDLMSNVYSSANAYFKQYPPAQTQVNSVYDKFITKQLSLLEGISKLTGIEKFGWYSGEELGANDGEVNKLDRFMITGSKVGGTTKIETLMLFTTKGDDIRQTNARSYLLEKINIVFDNSNGDFQLTIDFENSKYKAGTSKNLFESDVYNFEFNKEANGYDYSITMFSRGNEDVRAVYDKTNENINIFRQRLTKYLYYNHAIQILEFYDISDILKIKSDRVMTMIEITNDNAALLAEIVKVKDEETTPISGISQQLVPFAVNFGNPNQA